MRVRQSSAFELGYDDRVALPVLDNIIAIIVVIASKAAHHLDRRAPSP